MSPGGRAFYRRHPTCINCGRVLTGHYATRCIACAGEARRGRRQVELSYEPAERPAVDLAKVLRIGIPWLECATHVELLGRRLVVGYE